MCYLPSTTRNDTKVSNSTSVLFSRKWKSLLRERCLFTVCDYKRPVLQLYQIINKQK